jgi:hypothetical protein
MSSFAIALGPASMPLSDGDAFPDIAFSDKIDSATCTYLGIDKNPPLAFREIRGSFFVIEVFNIFCMRCPKNVPLLNSLYNLAEKDPQLKGKLKVIGIAVGNNRKELDTYARQYKVAFPAFADEFFSSHIALGKPRVPYTLFVKRSATGDNVVVSVHQSMFKPSTSLIDMARKLFLQNASRQ